MMGIPIHTETTPGGVLRQVPYYAVLNIVSYWNILWWDKIEMTTFGTKCQLITGLILGLRPANETWRFFVTTSLNDWAQA